MSLIGIPVIDNIAINFKCIYLYSRVLESAYGARKIKSSSGALKKIVYASGAQKNRGALGMNGALQTSENNLQKYLK